MMLACAPLIMAITRETVLHVAKLARLELGDSEIDRMQKDLGNILEYVNSLGRARYGIRRGNDAGRRARRSAPT